MTAPTPEREALPSLPPSVHGAMRRYRIANWGDGPEYESLVAAIKDYALAALASARPSEAPKCGHPPELIVKSAETGDPLYCEACDDKSDRRDAEQMEAEWQARALEAEETVRQLTRALREATEGPTFMGEPVLAPRLSVPQEAVAWPDVDQLAQYIRWLNGDNKKGAGALAESLLDWLKSFTHVSQEPHPAASPAKGMTPDQVRDGIADWIETNIGHREFWTPEVVELIRSIEIRPDFYQAPRDEAGNDDGGNTNG